MKKLDIIINRTVEKQIEEASNKYLGNDFDSCINLLLDSWAKLPSPKVVYAESFHIVEYLIETYLKKNDFVNIDYWHKILYLCDLERVDYGEREFLSGRLALHQNNTDDAKYYFWIAYQKSNGRIFKERDKKNIEFYKNEILGKYPF
jgi:hypothetical protein